MQIKSYPVGDLPLLAEILNQSKLAELIDQRMETHPNRQGPTVGKTIQIWLMYILSEIDHRLCAVEPWVEQTLEVLRWVCREPDLEPSHLSDDYLGSILEQIERSANWQAYEQDQNQQFIRLFDLQQQVVRVDATTVNGFRPIDGLFQMGHNKKGRSDLPQLKVMLASLDPLAMPIANCSVPGHQADDQLYIPIIKRARQSLAPYGLLYVGDTKLGNLANFAYLDRTNNYYLCPLSQTQFNTEQLHQAIQQVQQDKQAIKSIHQDGQLVAQVYELPAAVCRQDAIGHQWKQRHILVKSIQLAERKSAGLKKRLKKARQEILERFLPKQGRKIFTSIAQAKAFVDQVCKRRKVKKYLDADYELIYDAKRKREIVKCHLCINQSEWQRAVQQSGWRVYATNCPNSILSGEQVVSVYRKQFRIERNFHQLLNKVTQLMPIFLNKHHRIKALIRLLVLALKFSVVIQYKVRKGLEHKSQYLTGLVPYNPGLKVDKPTTARLLQAFKNIKLFVVRHTGKDPTYQVEALQEHQLTILNLLEMPTEIYLHPCQRT